MANTLISLPNEILHNILKYVDPCDLGRFFRVCKLLKKVVDDDLLFKEVYCYILVCARLLHCTSELDTDKLRKG